MPCLGRLSKPRFQTRQELEDRQQIRFWRRIRGLALEFDVPLSNSRGFGGLTGLEGEEIIIISLIFMTDQPSLIVQITVRTTRGGGDWFRRG